MEKAAMKRQPFDYIMKCISQTYNTHDGISYYFIFWHPIYIASSSNVWYNKAELGECRFRFSGFCFIRRLPLLKKEVRLWTQ